MPLQLRHATEADVPAIGRIGHDAFRGALSDRFFPPHLRRAEDPEGLVDGPQWRAARTLHRMKQGIPTLVVVDVSEDGTQETVVGYTQWEPPHGYDVDEAKLEAERAAIDAMDQKPPSSLDQAALDELVSGIDKACEKALGKDAHKDMWCKCTRSPFGSKSRFELTVMIEDVLILAVDPSHHRRGVGKMLLQWGLDQARSKGQDVFLAATEVGKFLYTSAGFKDLEDTYEVIGLKHTTMVWEAPKAN